jgi:transposase
MLKIDDLLNDPTSFLRLKTDDPLLRKLETYRLYRTGHSATRIAAAFGFARPYLYEMWQHFEADGAMALADKHWGAAPRKLTGDVEAAIIRAKAINPQRSDADLAVEFGLSHSKVFRLLKEHGIQDLHRLGERR